MISAIANRVGTYNIIRRGINPYVAKGDTMNVFEKFEKNDSRHI